MTAQAFLPLLDTAAEAQALRRELEVAKARIADLEYGLTKVGASWLRLNGDRPIADPDDWSAKVIAQGGDR